MLRAIAGARLAHVSVPAGILGLGFVSAFTFADGAAWLASGPEGTVVWRIDAFTKQPTGSVTAGGLVTGIAYGAGSIWISDAEDGLVLRVDPKDNAIVSKIPVVGSPSGLAYGYGRLWVSVD